MISARRIPSVVIAAPKSLRDFLGWPVETLDGAAIPYEDWPLVRAIRERAVR